MNYIQPFAGYINTDPYQVGTIWTPASGIDGSVPEYWWMGDAGVSDTASAVDSWADQSGNGHTLTGSGDNRPLVSTGAFGGRTSLYFDGDYLEMGSLMGDARSFWIVLQPATTYTSSSSRAVVIGASTSENIAYGSNSALLSGEVLSYIDGTHQFRAVTSSVYSSTSGTPEILGFRGHSDTFDVDIYKNGGPEIGDEGDGGNNMDWDGGSNTYVGGLVGSDGFNGYIAEIVIYDDFINGTNERNLIEGYLAWKWGLESYLASDHRWKYGAPYESGTEGTNYYVTVPSSNIDADLTDFPLMVQLQDMPATFWTKLIGNASGEHIRAYESDEVTELATDLTLLDETEQNGRLIVKCDLSSSSDTTINIRLHDENLIGYESTDTYGSRAVWTDYEVVRIHPDSSINRTDDSTYTQDNTQPNTPWKDSNNYAGADWTGTDLQDLAINGSDIYRLKNDNSVSKYAMSDTSTLVDSSSTIIADTGLSFTGSGQVKGIAAYDDELFIVIQDDGDNTKTYVGVFNEDLDWDRNYDLSSVFTTAGEQGHGICSDGAGNFFVNPATTTGIFEKFNSSFTNTATITSDTTFTNSTFRTTYNTDDDKILVLDSTADTIVQIDPDGTHEGVVWTNHYGGTMRGFAYNTSNGDLWVGDSESDRWTLSKDKDWFDWGYHHDDDSREAATASNVFTISTRLAWNVVDVDIQRGFLALADSTASTDRVDITYDEGPDRIGCWDNSNGWLYGDAGQGNPQYMTPITLACAYDNTTARYMFVNGVKTTDNTITAKKGDSNTDGTTYLITGNQDFDNSTTFPYTQFEWFRHDVMSDAWMVADHENWLTPTSFYNTITQG